MEVTERKFRSPRNFKWNIKIHLTFFKGVIQIVLKRKDEINL